MSSYSCETTSTVTPPWIAVSSLLRETESLLALLEVTYLCQVKQNQQRKLTIPGSYSFILLFFQFFVLQHFPAPALSLDAVYFFLFLYMDLTQGYTIFNS